MKDGRYVDLSDPPLPVTPQPPISPVSVVELLVQRNRATGAQVISLAELGVIANRVANDPQREAGIDWWLGIDHLMRTVTEHIETRAIPEPPPGTAFIVQGGRIVGKIVNIGE